MADDNNCCNGLFADFKFENIREALPPERKGVYIIRIKQRGRPLEEVVEKLEKVILTLNWPLVGKKMFNRIKRLEKVNKCPVI